MSTQASQYTYTKQTSRNKKIRIYKKKIYYQLDKIEVQVTAIEMKIITHLNLSNI